MVRIHVGQPISPKSCGPNFPEIRKIAYLTQMSGKKETGHNPIAYRPDIDGLRAIAVGAVLLYHAHLGVRGGFVGVDIFFVISGFLITSIILKDRAATEGFSLFQFWERRIRRILPALLVVVASTVVIGCLVLLPSDLMDLGKSTIAQSVYGANFYFWLSGGYFAQPSTLKPLLHTWSLSVEEQYYLLYPVLFIVGRKWKISTLFRVVGVMALGSLALSIYLTRSKPEAAFYLLPTRAWELLGGGLLALRPAHKSRLLSEVLGWGGLAALGLAFCVINSSTPFPGWAAILPCAGAMALLMANHSQGEPSTMARLLSLRPLVFIGKISYSLYLWHWPILVYAAYWEPYGILDWPMRVGLLGLSVALAAASWKFIETPFRTRRALPRRRGIFAFGLSAPVVCSLAGAVLLLGQGMPARFDEAMIKCDEARIIPPLEYINLKAVQSGQFPRKGQVDRPVRCLLWGDSHAAMISPALGELARKFSSSVELASYPATAPILDYQSHQPASLGSDSEPWSQAIADHIASQHISNVLLVARWSAYGSPGSTTKNSQSRQYIATKLAATVRALREAGARVWIMKDVPVQPVDVPKAMAIALRKGSSGDVGITKANYLISSGLEDEMLRAAATNGATILNPEPYFFRNRETCLLMSSGYPLYSDNNHVSNRGAMMLMDLFDPIFEANDAAHDVKLN